MNISQTFSGGENVVRLSRAGEVQNSPLIAYTLEGLQRCWMPEHGRWSHIYHLDGRRAPNQSIPRSDVFYSLNVLLGLSRLKVRPSDLDYAKIFEQNASALPELPVAKYAYGMALWAGAELALEVPEDVARSIDRLLSNERAWMSFRAQDIGMLVSGVVAQSRAGNNRWRRFAQPLFSFLTQRYCGPAGLFFDEPAGFRRRFASFATQTYLTLACYHYGDFAGDASAIDIAKKCTRRLIALQGPQGEWPWFFDAQRGQVLDFYEVYSVHQYGMAPAFLECAELHDVREARAALIKGFRWVLGDNQLGRSMMVPDKRLSIRSQVRKGELHTNRLRMLRALRNAYVPRPAALIDPADIDLRLECRSYELGWILWSFGQRSDLDELTHHPAFSP